MRATLEEILLLQTEYEAANTPSMKRRGVLVRDDVRDWLQDRAPLLAAAARLPLDDLGVNGRDGTGQKTEVPWCRFHSKLSSPSATTGWYVVYLFDALGNAVYLSLNQGTTRWTGTDFEARSPAELAAQVRWARRILGAAANDRTDILTDIELSSRRSPLGAGYELGNVYAIRYPVDEIPDDSHLSQDAVFMAGLLGQLYEAAQVTPSPGDTPENIELIETVERAAGRWVGKAQGQGFRLTQPEKVLIENQAMQMATEYYVELGWGVVDVSKANGSYDLHVTRGDETLHVEVKGTTSLGEQIVVTRSEVTKQRTYYPENALVIIRCITLDRTTSPATVNGGELIEISPWQIDDDSLKVVAYFYKTGLA